MYRNSKYIFGLPNSSVMQFMMLALGVLDVYLHQQVCLKFMDQHQKVCKSLLITHVLALHVFKNRETSKTNRTVAHEV